MVLGRATLAILTVATQFAGTGGGEFDTLLHPELAAQVSACSAKPMPVQVSSTTSAFAIWFQELKVGEVHQGTLGRASDPLPDGSQYDLWSFPGAHRGRSLRLEMRSADFDAYLAVGRLSGTSFTCLEAQGHAASGTNAALQFDVPADWEPDMLLWVIASSAGGGRKTGPYTLRVGYADPPNTKR